MGQVNFRMQRCATGTDRLGSGDPWHYPHGVLCRSSETVAVEMLNERPALARKRFSPIRQKVQ